MNVEVYEVEFSFQADRQEWIWRLRDPSSRVIAVCGEGYPTLEECQEIAWKLFPPAQVVMETEEAVESAEENGGRAADD